MDTGEILAAILLIAIFTPLFVILCAIAAHMVILVRRDWHKQ